MNIRSHIAIFLLFSATAALAAPNTFYTTLMERGQADFGSGDYQRASEELRIASFGLLDQIPSYETAEIYYALSLQRIGKKDDAAKAVLQLVQTERLAPTYRALNIDPSVRAAFVSALPALFTPDQLTSLSVTQFMDTVRQATTSTTASGNLPHDSSSISSRAALAESKLREGHVSEAQQLAASVLASDPGNGTAHLVLGRIAAHDGRPADVISHLTKARTVRGLSEEDIGALFIAYVSQGDYANATNLTGALSDQTRQQPAIERALARLEEATRPPVQPAARSTTPATVPVAGSPARDQHQSEQRTVVSAVASPSPQPAPPARTYTAPATTAPTTTASRTDSGVPTQSKPAPATHSAPLPQSASVTHADPPPPPPSSVKTKTPPTVTVSTTSGTLREAQQALSEGKYLHARELLLTLLPRSDLSRGQLLDVSRGLCQVSAFKESESGYDRVGRLRQGEDVHLFYKAVNFYELGDYPRARDYLKLALPVIPMTPTVVEYKAKIEATR